MKARYFVLGFMLALSSSAMAEYGYPPPMGGGQPMQYPGYSSGYPTTVAATRVTVTTATMPVHSGGCGGGMYGGGCGGGYSCGGGCGVGCPMPMPMPMQMPCYGSFGYAGYGGFGCGGAMGMYPYYPYPYPYGRTVCNARGCRMKPYTPWSFSFGFRTASGAGFNFGYQNGMMY